MGLFLLGIPLTFIGLYTMAKDVSYTIKDEGVRNNDISITQQKNNIDTNFITILKHCNAECKIKNGRIYNIKKGQYGGMEVYLTRKGYSKEAIDYCKAKFDKLGDIEQSKYLSEIRKKIEDFEEALKFNATEYVTLNINRHTPKTKSQVENDVNKIAQYFTEHNNDNIQVSIIMGGTQPHHNHSETWVIKKPIGYDALEYYFDVSEALGIK